MAIRGTGRGRPYRPLYLNVRRCFIGMGFGCVLGMLVLHRMQFDCVSKAMLTEGFTQQQIKQTHLNPAYTGHNQSWVMPGPKDPRPPQRSEMAVLPVSGSRIVSGAEGRVWPRLQGEQHDRIQDQLRLRPPIAPTTPYKRILVFTGYGSAIVSGDIRFHRDQCPVRACTLTDDPNEAPTSDAILFQGEIPFLEHARPAGQIWILHLLESPLHTQSFEKFHDVINWTATYRRDSTIVTPYEKYVPYTNPTALTMQNSTALTMQPEGNITSFASGKRRLVAWFVSNCSPSNGRDEYVKELQNHIRVDVYGDCGSMQCYREDPTCFLMLKNTYKFYLAFENSNCRDYITEKFFTNSLKNNVIPVVMGPRKKDYQKVAPPGSFIHVDDFSSPRELAKYLHKLDKDDNLYNSYFEWRHLGRFLNTKFWCRLCAMLHEADRTSHVTWYPDIDKWWRKRTCILPETRRGQRWAKWR